jgi:RND family efflux transporter MFP subunit
LKKLLVVALLAAAVGAPAWWLVRRRNAPPEVAFARVARETLVSTLVTNGKVEPEEWIAVRAPIEGALSRLLVERGAPVRQGDLLAEIDTRDAQTELAAAEARIAQARAEIEVFDRGGSPAEIAEIEGGLAKARLDRDIARRDLAAARRLVERKAAIASEVTALEDRLKQSEAGIAALERKRASLTSPAGRAAAEARLREATVAAAAARRRIEQGALRSPMDGVLYQLDVRPGAWLRSGDSIGEVGRVERLRVIVYVDEPELGRVGLAMPVTVTWDARPGRRWEGRVAKMPARIAPLGTRQVGEVICRIDNPGRELPPGANINAEVRSREVAGALTVPKEALRRDGEATVVFVLEGDRVTRREVQVGTTSVTRAEIVSGLTEGALVALPTGTPLAGGDRVRAVVR